MTSPRVFNLLLVDDDSLIHQSFRLCLPAHWRALSATRPSEIPTGKSFHAAFVDMHLSSETPNGLKVLEHLKCNNPGAELIAMSGEVRRDLMEAALRAGAERFLAKPLHSEEILLLLQKIEALWDLRQGASRRQAGTRWIGGGSASSRVLGKIAALKGEPSPVLLEGESGVGKDVAARLLNEQEDSERPFIAVNIAALPENLFESELFGHVKGAFTGADRDKVGLAEAADGGDLFLDEIEALPLAQQVKLLRFLENGEIRRVGGRDPVRVRCRVIAASNRPLEKMVKDGQFREDLYFRLNAHRIDIPPLRERLEDLGDLVTAFFAAERPRRNKSLAEDGLAALHAYPWPGNVRELKRVCQQLSLTAPLPLIREEDVRGVLNTGAGENSAPKDLSLGLTRLTEDFEREIISRALALTKDVEGAANLLKVSRSGLYRKIKDLQLESES